MKRTSSCLVLVSLFFSCSLELPSPTEHTPALPNMDIGEVYNDLSEDVSEDISEDLSSDFFEVPNDFSCFSYEKLCDGVCTDTEVDTLNCGGCGISCSETQICIRGACTCPTGKSPCSDQCHDFLTSIEACGGCGNSCSYPNAEAGCNNGICIMVDCHEGFYDCNQDHSDGCESTHSELQNCGGCGNSCSYPNAEAGCNNGICEFLDCDEGFGNCDEEIATGCEVNLVGDAFNCGACGFSCPDNDPFHRGCVDGSCACVCGNGICDDDQERDDCPEDCPYTVVCGDGFCDARGGAENATKCPEDCAEMPECGINSCQMNPDSNTNTIPENHNNCSDCGNIFYVLNDEICGFRENCVNSPEDCGACNFCYLE